MRRREQDFYLRDMLAASERARSYAAACTAADLATDPMRCDAILRNLITIGEAVTALPAALLAQQPQIPWQQIRAMRNLVVHAYWQVDAAIVLLTVQRDLPLLEAAVRCLLADLEGWP
ncbi:MAG: DUF86 domain-containing protein [Fimbriimonadaceae bacterium]|nr:DUF86 domain-containing protein [Fimbriimonadaceae bacterium]